MIGSTRSNFYGYMLLLCMLTLMLALAWPAAASAQVIPHQNWARRYESR